MSHLFEFTPKATLAEDQLEICYLLAKLVKDQAKIGLRNFYKELPIQSSLSLESFDDARFEVTPAKVHLMVLQEKQRTILTLPNGQAVLAECPTVDVERGLAVLQDFQYVVLYSEQRSDFRVRFDRPINVILNSDDRKMPGMLRDISMGGACLSTFVKGLVLEASVQFALKTLDPTTGAIINIQLPSKVVRLERESPPYFCCVHFELEGEDETQLMNFINQRQMEIIKVLRG